MCMGGPAAQRGGRLGVGVGGINEPFLPGEPLFTQHRAGWRAAPWAMHLSLMSSNSSLHYPWYWLVWSQPGALRNNNKWSKLTSFFYFLPLFSLFPSHPTDTQKYEERQIPFFFLTASTLNLCTIHSCFIDQDSINTFEALQSWAMQPCRVMRGFSSLLAKLAL